MPHTRVPLRAPVTKIPKPKPRLRSVVLRIEDHAGTIEYERFVVPIVGRTHRCNPRTRSDFGCAWCYPMIGLGERIAELADRPDLYRSITIVPQPDRPIGLRHQFPLVQP